MTTNRTVLPSIAYKPDWLYAVLLNTDEQSLEHSNESGL